MPSAKRPGRRPGATQTRDAIVRAARRQFGERGYGETTVRSVAEEAGVDSALVMQFFGSKDGLFASVVDWPFDPSTEIAAVIDPDVAEVARRLVALFVRTWDGQRGRNPIVTLLRTAMTRPAAERQLREFLEVELLLPLVADLECDEPRLRASLVATHLLGLGVTRYILHLEPLATMAPEQAVALLAPPVQAALTGPLPDL